VRLVGAAPGVAQQRAFAGNDSKIGWFNALTARGVIAVRPTDPTN
jgi:hypothetical protein